MAHTLTLIVKKNLNNENDNNIIIFQKETNKSPTPDQNENVSFSREERLQANYNDRSCGHAYHFKSCTNYH